MRILLALISLFAATPAMSRPDPAVVHANASRKDAIEYKEGWFGRGDTRLHYVEAGSGPLVILYHGFPSFWYSWFDQMEVLKTRYRVVAVDGLGAGLSAKPRSLEPYRVRHLAAQLDGLARNLNGSHRFILIGHDWGAALSFAYAQAYPGRLNAVIGLSAPSFNVFLELVASSTEQQARSQYMRLFRSLALEDVRKRNLPEQIWRQSYGGLIASNALADAEGALFRTALSDPSAIDGGMNWYRANIPDFNQIGRSNQWPSGDPLIRVPALLITGDADRTFVPEYVDRLRDRTTDLEVVQLAGVGHWTPMEKPSLANVAILSFLHRRLEER